jgi:tetratricopeptide (TPR) repeat protein
MNNPSQSKRPHSGALPAPQFIEALRLIESGRIADAEQHCRALLDTDPKDVNIRALLGAILLKRNQPAEAERQLRTAIAQAPGFPKPHEDLGILLLEAGRAAEALPVLQRAVQLDDTLEIAWLHLGKTLVALGRGKEADVAFERSFALSPHRKALAQAARLHQEGKVQAAEQVYRDVLRKDPRNVDALRLLAMAAMAGGQLEEAERQLRRCIGLAPDFAGAILDFGRLMKERDHYEEAIGAFRRVIDIEPQNRQAHFLLGGTLAAAGFTYEALKSYENTLALNAGHAGALLGLGHMLKTVGRQDEAIDAYRRCIALKPDHGEIYWSLANLKTYRFQEAEVDEMRRWSDTADIESVGRVNFLFALAKHHEDCGEFDAAWEYYRKGNEQQRQLVQYDPVQTEVVTDAVIDAYTPDLLQRLAGGGNPDSSPIFIMGLPRSGSTLTEQILASHSQVEGTSELPYLGRVSLSLNRHRADGLRYPEVMRHVNARRLAELGGEYLQLAQMHRVQGRPRFIDKMPNNFPHIGLLHLILPNARIVDVRRDPRDACLGNYRQLYARGQTFTYDLTDIGEYYLQYRRLMDHWHEVLPGRVLTLRYEELVHDFENQVRRLLEFCDLPFEDACLRYFETDRPIRTASSEQVRQPIYSSSIGHWRNYREHLHELLEILAPVLED